MKRPRARLLAGLLLPVVMAGAAAPAAARILKTRRPGEYKELALVIGSGFEFESDAEESEYGLPFFAEYGITPALELSVEPSYVVIRKRSGGTIQGLGDLETNVSYEFVSERRSRPAIAMLGGIKWPTAPAGAIGTGKLDASLGAVASKELPRFDLEFNAIYTFTGNPSGVQLRDTFEASAATEVHLGRRLDLLAEFVTASGAGGRFRAGLGGLGGLGNIGGPEQGQIEYEATLGIAEHPGSHLKLEQGGIFKSDGAWQVVLGWEYDFGEGK